MMTSSCKRLLLYRSAFALLLGFLGVSCAPSKEVIKLHEVPNFDASAEVTMLFLTFDLNKKGKRETAALTKSFAAAGKVKDSGSHVHGLSRIETVIYYSDGNPPKTLYAEHPLYKDREVFHPDGTIRKVSERASSGSLTLRIPVEKNMETLELFSTGPDHSHKKLFTLKFAL